MLSIIKLVHNEDLERCKDIYSYYRENQLIPELEDMSDLIGEITDILGMDEPFNSIAKLGTLVQQANEIKMDY